MKLFRNALAILPLALAATKEAVESRVAHSFNSRTAGRETLDAGCYALEETADFNNQPYKLFMICRCAVNPIGKLNSNLNMLKRRGTACAGFLPSSKLEFDISVPEICFGVARAILNDSPGLPSDALILYKNSDVADAVTRSKYGYTNHETLYFGKDDMRIGGFGYYDLCSNDYRR